MLRISSKLLLRILTDIRRALDLSKRGSEVVQFSTDKDSVTVGMTTADASVACQIPIGAQRITAAIPMHEFADLHGSSRNDVVFNRIGDETTIEFRDTRGIPCSTTVRNVPPAHNAKAVSTEPNWLVSNSSRLGTVLRQAASISDPGSRRYSLGCIRLRGSDGQVAATDGRQAFVASGFALPVDEVLIPGAVVDRFPQLANCSAISVGRTDEWFSIRCAIGMQRWLIDLKISTQGRFPNVDQCFPDISVSRSEVKISDRDAQYLLQHLKSLLGTSAELNPVTLDLSYDPLQCKQFVQLRFRKQDDKGLQDRSSTITEVTLDTSRYDGYSTRVAFDGHLLLHALRLGFRTFQMQSPCLSIYAFDGRSKFVLVSLHESLTLSPVSNMTSIVSSGALAAA